jgi:hypothetical protein
MLSVVRPTLVTIAMEAVNEVRLRMVEQAQAAEVCARHLGCR